MVGPISTVDLGFSRVDFAQTAVDGPKDMRICITKTKFSFKSAYDFLYFNCLGQTISKNLVLNRLSGQERKISSRSSLVGGGWGGVIKT